MEARELAELINLEEPAWPTVQEWIADAKNQVEVLPPVEEVRGAELFRVQVTTRSPLGAMAYETGGLLVDHGWLRVLGAGHPRLPRGLGEWNEEQCGSVGGSGFLLIADDVVGGFFVLNGGALPGDAGHVHYLDPRSAQAFDLGGNYSQFLGWALEGDLAAFYEELRWEGWEEEVRELAGDHTFSFYPFLSTEGPPLTERRRSAVPSGEAYGLMCGLAEFFATGDHAEGE